MSYGDLTEPQAMTVLKDAAEVARALTGLDRHYTAAVQSWEPITEADQMGRAAVVCAAHAGYDEPDYSIDRRGWHPPVQLVDGPRLHGLDGVLQAQNNLLFHQRHQPDGHSLRLILDSQRIVSTRGAAISEAAGAPSGLVDRWGDRAETYTRLVDQTRNLRASWAPATRPDKAPLRPPEAVLSPTLAMRTNDNCDTSMRCSPTSTADWARPSAQVPTTAAT